MVYLASVLPLGPSHQLARKVLADENIRLIELDQPKACNATFDRTG
jgi:hypothetical protein